VIAKTFHVLAGAHDGHGLGILVDGSDDEILTKKSESRANTVGKYEVWFTGSQCGVRRFDLFEPVS